jgi:hypothetical protein
VGDVGIKQRGVGGYGIRARGVEGFKIIFKNYFGVFLEEGGCNSSWRAHYMGERQRKEGK